MSIEKLIQQIKDNKKEIAKLNSEIERLVNDLIPEFVNSYKNFNDLGFMIEQAHNLGNKFKINSLELIDKVLLDNNWNKFTYVFDLQSIHKDNEYYSNHKYYSEDIFTHPDLPKLGESDKVYVIKEKNELYDKINSISNVEDNKVFRRENRNYYNH